MSRPKPSPTRTHAPTADTVSGSTQLIWELMLRQTANFDKPKLTAGYQTLHQTLGGLKDSLLDLTQRLFNTPGEARVSMANETHQTLDSIRKQLETIDREEKKLWHPGGYSSAEIIGLSKHPHLNVQARRLKIRRKLLQIDLKPEIDRLAEGRKYAYTLIRFCQTLSTSSTTFEDPLTLPKDPQIIDALSQILNPK